MRAISQDTKEKIIYLRKQGHSISEIGREYQLSKSTVLRYVGDIAILPEYRERWLVRSKGARVKAEREWSVATGRAQQLLKSVTAKDLALAGAMLYWAEGSKSDFSLSNTDPTLVRLFVFILRNVFNIKDSDLVVSIRIYEDLDRGACLRFWSDVTGLRLGSKTSIDVLVGSKRGKLKYGMCRMRVRKGGLLRKQLFAIMKRVTELAISPHSSTDRTADS